MNWVRWNSGLSLAERGHPVLIPTVCLQPIPGHTEPDNGSPSSIRRKIGFGDTPVGASAGPMSCVRSNGCVPAILSKNVSTRSSTTSRHIRGQKSFVGHETTTSSWSGPQRMHRGSITLNVSSPNSSALSSPTQTTSLTRKSPKLSATFSAIGIVETQNTRKLI